MASKTRRSLGVRIARSGILQAVAEDAAIVVGLVLVGVGIAQMSRPLVWVYAGAVLIAGSVLVGLARSRERTTAPRKGDA